MHHLVNIAGMCAWAWGVWSATRLTGRILPYQIVLLLFFGVACFWGASQIRLTEAKRERVEAQLKSKD